MSIRIPTQTVFSKSVAGDTGTGSVAGMTVFGPFVLPQDTDNVAVKFVASVGGGVSAVFQTTDDGGTTFYDVARTSVISANTNGTAEWLSIPTVGAGVRSQKTFSGSILTGTTGQTAASTLGQGQYSGLPLLGTLARVGVIFSGNVAAGSASIMTVTVLANNQSSANG